ncbi:MAG: hypothetical protein DMG24_05405, partial [Acidobacteria bacterium]
MGGKILFLNSFELRFPLEENKYGFVLFHDAGGGGGSPIIKVSVFLECRTKLLIRLVTALVFFTAEAAGHGFGWAQTLDRVVASVGDVAITESDVVREYGLEILIQEGKLPKPPPDAATLDRVRDRLIDQTLLAQETRAEGLEWPGARSAAQQRLAEVRKRFSSAKAFDSALRSLGMSENQFLEVLAAQQRTLRLIEQRLRPAASP